MRQLSLREIQLEELEILKQTAKFLERNKIPYTLAGGTLLGAVRHQGFIPWDDDIDIIVPRPGYEKLRKLLKKEQIGDFEFRCFEDGTSDYPFAKVVNPKIKITSKSSIDRHLWIDIFPADGVPTKKEEQKKLFKYIELRKGGAYLKTTSLAMIWRENKSLANRVLKTVLKPMASLRSVRWYTERILEKVKKNSYEEAEYAAEVCWGYGENEIMPKRVFEELEKIDFEGCKFYAVKDYDRMLASLYGADYMKLPPKNERMSHYIEAVKEEN